MTKIVMNCLVVAGLGFWAKEFVNDVISLAIVSVLSLFAYLVVSYANKVFLPEEQALINKTVGKNVFVF